MKSSTPKSTTPRSTRAKRSASPKKTATPADELKSANGSKGSAAKRIRKPATRRASPPAGGDGPSLVVVESPAKAKTINRYLGRGYKVLPSMGHVRDLPVKDLGVDVEKNFEPRYVTIRGKGKIIKELRSAAARARAIYLAVDLDREGEAIAWHLVECLDGATRVPVHRVIMNEITERAVKDAFEHPRTIDPHKVNAQQARRILDRLVGYQVSPILWKIVHRRTSAGRVQSVALRLVVEREDEIQKFEKKEYWTIEAVFASASGETFRARLIRKAGEKVTADDESQARALEAGVKAEARFQVAEVNRRERKRSPRPPFITSTLQQDASQRLSMSPRRTMQIAQELYEGLDLGSGDVTGLITYMRTDSVRLAAEAVTETREFIASTFGRDYLPAEPPVYRLARKGPVQDAHEAIRPTSVVRRPEELRSLSEDQRRLYDLVWRRMVACQMKPAVDAVTTIDIEGGAFLFRAVGSTPVFAGYRAVYADSAAAEAEDGAHLPSVEQGQTLTMVGLEARQHFTEPPPRYSEATLIRELEANGVGRPSTYATIVNTITQRKYTTRERGRLVPSELGRTVLRILLEAFPAIFTVDFTAKMEEELDEIESGDIDWRRVVGDFYSPFSKDLAAAKERSAEIKRALTDVTEIPCPRCGKPLVVKWGRNGRFLACSGFPECRHSQPLPEDEEAAVNAGTCDKCGSPMVVRSGRFGRFLACRSYPECKNTRPLPVGVRCPEEGCTGELTERRTRKGRVFYGCSRYPECKFATWERPVPGPCAACGSPALVEKSQRGTHITRCPRCGHTTELAPVAAEATE